MSIEPNRAWHRNYYRHTAMKSWNTDCNADFSDKKR
jgi:hypothetical protein